MGTYTLTHTHANLVFGQNVNNLLLRKRLFVCICVCVFVYVYASLSPVRYPCGADTLCAEGNKNKSQDAALAVLVPTIGIKILGDAREHATFATQPAA